MRPCCDRNPQRSTKVLVGSSTRRVLSSVNRLTGAYRDGAPMQAAYGPSVALPATLATATALMNATVAKDRATPGRRRARCGVSAHDVRTIERLRENLRAAAIMERRLVCPRGAPTARGVCALGHTRPNRIRPMDPPSRERDVVAHEGPGIAKPAPRLTSV